MYCAHELSSENLRAWVDLNLIIHKWSTFNEEERVVHLNKIYTKYIAPDAELEINIQNSTRNAFLFLLGKGSFVVRDGMQNLNASESDQQLEVLMGLNKSVVENLADTFSR